MKKLIFVLCVCAGLCACTSEDDVLSSSSSENLGEATAFLTVNLKDVNSSTRATVDEDNPFVSGTTDEQTVKNAYFYFYDDNGNYMAKGSATPSGTATTPSTDNGEIEWESATVVAIYGLDKQYAFPTQMLTVLNKPSGVDLTNKSLSDATKTLAGTPWGDTTNGFVMSTSVYEDGSSGAIYNTTALTDDDFQEEPIDLTNDYPNGGVDVYVERLAAKVSVSDGIQYNNFTAEVDGTEYSAVDITANIPHIASDDIAGIAVRLVGWDVNGTARDAYVSKQIEAWSNSSFNSSWSYNDVSNKRCYWAESPNYGDATTVYPTSSKGNTDADEEGKDVTYDGTTVSPTQAPLNEYLKYTSLYSPLSFTTSSSTPYAYCGENTNTTTVLVDSASTGITNLLVKAQALTEDNSGTWHGSDLVEYHGSLYTAADFCNTTVADVVEYDFTTVVDEVIGALKTEYPDLATYLDDLNAAIIKDNVWVIPAVPYHLPNGRNVNGNQEPQKFDGSLLSLYNLGDGNVDLFFNGAQPYWGYCEFDYNRSTGEITEYTPYFTAINDGIMDKYPESDIVYGGKSLDDYEFMFHVDEESLGPLEELGLIAAGVVFQINGDYYMILGNNFYFDTEDAGDPNFSGSHTYTFRNFLLRAITVEADGIDSEFGSHYPNLYANGMMYYSVPIEHLAPATEDGSMTEGEYGIVRNHWYDITVSYLTGLGRGIAQPTEVIIPQPEITYYYLGADINILSWKMVNQGVDF